jgi:hypothetical protein
MKIYFVVHSTKKCGNGTYLLPILLYAVIVISPNFMVVIGSSYGDFLPTVDQYFNDICFVPRFLFVFHCLEDIPYSVAK